MKLKYYDISYAEFPFSFDGAIDEVEMLSYKKGN